MHPHSKEMWTRWCTGGFNSQAPVRIRKGDTRDVFNPLLDAPPGEEEDAGAGGGRVTRGRRRTAGGGESNPAAPDHAPSWRGLWRRRRTKAKGKDASAVDATVSAAAAPPPVALGGRGDAPASAAQASTSSPAVASAASTAAGPVAEVGRGGPRTMLASAAAVPSGERADLALGEGGAGGASSKVFPLLHFVC